MTKVVDEVTIGDFGQATSCAAPMRTKIVVREHDSGDSELGGDFDQSSQIAVATSWVPLPAAPEKVTYQIPATGPPEPSFSSEQHAEDAAYMESITGYLWPAGRPTG